MMRTVLAKVGSSIKLRWEEQKNWRLLAAVIVGYSTGGFMKYREGEEIYDRVDKLHEEFEKRQKELRKRLSGGIM